MGDEAASDPGTGRRQQRWRFTVPAILLLLRERPDHGYELLSRLPEVFPGGDRMPDPGAFYRTLRTLEDEGALESSWQSQQSGPPRRVYQLTKSGAEQLDAWSVAIQREREGIERFLKAYRNAT